MKDIHSRLTALLLCAFVIISALALTSCEKEIETKNRVFYDYFDTVSVIYDYSGGTDEEFDSACRGIEYELKTCHELFDIYNTYYGINNLKTVNDSAGKGPVKVDVRIIDLLEEAVRLYELTDGNVNVMMGSVLSIWHEHRTEGTSVPDMDALVAANAHTSIKNLVIDRENMTVEITDPEASLDVGAIAKGFTAEHIYDMLTEYGIDGYAINLGGNLRTVGTKPDGSGWVSGIQNPDKNAPDPYVAKLTISDSALVTSGVYERFYTVDGVQYHHIINKDTLMPEHNYLSVTVHTESSTVADALSTALFNMSIEDGRRVISSLSDTEVIYVLQGGGVERISN
jgi:thiamine biosynthesis lipoprotein